MIIASLVFSMSLTTNQGGKIKATTKNRKGLEIEYTGPQLSPDTIEKIIQSMVAQINNSSPMMVKPPSMEGELNTVQTLWSKLDREVSSLPLDQYGSEKLARRAFNVMASVDMKYIGQLVQKSKREILTGSPRTGKTFTNFGHRCFYMVSACLSDIGLDFGTDVGDWVPPDQRNK